MIIKRDGKEIEVDIDDAEFYYEDFKYLAEYYFDDILHALVVDEDEFNYNYGRLLNAVMRDMKKFYTELLKRGIIVNNDTAREVYLMLIDEYLKEAYEIGDENYVRELDKYLNEIESGGRLDGLLKLMEEIDSKVIEMRRSKAARDVAIGAATLFAALFSTKAGRKLLEDLAKILDTKTS